MMVTASSVPGITIHGPDSEAFRDALPAIVGRAPTELLRPALAFSVIVANSSNRTVGLLGVRFDMVSPNAKQYSVVHYSDTLRNPEKADFAPGVKRFVCAEPAYTSLVLEKGIVANTRGRMNLDNLRTMLRISAAIDCVAFSDGEFLGPDSHKAYERFGHERELERAVIDELLLMEHAPIQALEAVLFAAVQDPVERSRRIVARRLLEGLETGGTAELFTRARNYRCRIPLTR